MQDSTFYADPGLKMWDTFACATPEKLTNFIISIAVLENVPPDAWLQKIATFSTLNIALGGDSPLSKWRVHLLKGLVRTAVSVHLQRFGE
jgi:hypothetical protein